MSDYIKREDAINTVSSLVRDEEIFVQEYAIDRIERIPSADVVEVVRCKDCKHRERCYSAIVMTKECKGDTFFKDIDYCSEGKLKE